MRIIQDEFWWLRLPSIAMSIKKTDGLQFSSYMDYNCKVLENANEYESDQLLVAFVRLQVISESYHRNVLSKSKESRDSDDLKTPSWMYVKAFRKELQDTWKSFPPTLQQNGQPPHQSFQSIV
jgi:hypothetical protein